VLNRAEVVEGTPHPPGSVDEVKIIASAVDACRRLREAGYVLVVVTNQPDVARGTETMEGVGAINGAVGDVIEIDEFVVCPHDDQDGCACRKPKPGMLTAAAGRRGLDLGRSFMVGDRWRRHRGRAAGRLHHRFRRPGIHWKGGRRIPTWWLGSWPRQSPGSSQSTSPSRRDQIHMPELKDLRIKIFADGADREGMVRLAADPHIKGFTTNPTLMNAAGIRDMEGFAREILEAIPDKPISFEVFADEFDEMERQALKITTWGPNVYVKIPVTNTRGVSASSLTSRLCEQWVKLNLTALMTPVQVAEVAEALAGGPPAIVSVFAGRIADSGVDPIPLMRESLEILKPHAGIELLWASPREVLNIVQADQLGCHIITVTHDLLKKLSSLGKDLTEFSLDTVKMFFNDGQAAGFAI